MNVIDTCDSVVIRTFDGMAVDGDGGGGSFTVGFAGG